MSVWYVFCHSEKNFESTKKSKPHRRWENFAFLTFTERCPMSDVTEVLFSGLLVCGLLLLDSLEFFLKKYINFLMMPCNCTYHCKLKKLTFALKGGQPFDNCRTPFSSFKRRWYGNVFVCLCHEQLLIAIEVTSLKSMPDAKISSFFPMSLRWGNSWQSVMLKWPYPPFCPMSLRWVTAGSLWCWSDHTFLDSPPPILPISRISSFWFFFFSSPLLLHQCF